LTRPSAEIAKKGHRRRGGSTIGPPVRRKPCSYERGLLFYTENNAGSYRQGKRITMP
jgi:hypothetical protein